MNICLHNPQWVMGSLLADVPGSNPAGNMRYFMRDAFCFARSVWLGTLYRGRCDYDPYGAVRVAAGEYETGGAMPVRSGRARAACAG